MELNNTLTLVKTPEADFERINGVLKRHVHHPVVVKYKECLKNFAASLGGHSLDGCGEFMSTSSNQLMCAVCGCHRNFHRRETEEFMLPIMEIQSHINGDFDSLSPSNSPSPPPISSAYYPSAPHMLMSLSHRSGLQLHGSDKVANKSTVVNSSGSCKKRHRTKFTMEQKGKMVQFAERLGWKMQKKDESVINEFCNEIGVERGVFKVWMHNNKNTVGGKDHNALDNDNKTVVGICTTHGNGMGTNGDEGNGERKQDGEMGMDKNHVRTDNGSSSCS